MLGNDTEELVNLFKRKLHVAWNKHHKALKERLISFVMKKQT